MSFRVATASFAGAVMLVGSVAACSSSSSGKGTVLSGGGSHTTAAVGTTAAAPVTSAAATGGGGGGGASSDYCNSIRTAKSRLDILTGNNSQAFLSEIGAALTVFQDLESKAPDSIKPSWDVMISGIKSFADAAQKAGITDAELKNPASLTPTQIQALEAAAAQLQTTQFSQATAKIGAEVAADCGVDINK
jgi:hypothetical protein